MKKIFSIMNVFTRLPEWLISTLVLFALLFIVFARVLLRPQLMVIGSDFIQFYFWEHFTRSELAAGRLPIWNPYFFSGYPLLANPQSLVFYPPAMLLRLVPLGYALGLGIFFAFVVGGRGHVWADAASKFESRRRLYISDHVYVGRRRRHSHRSRPSRMDLYDCLDALGDMELAKTLFENGKRSAISQA